VVDCFSEAVDMSSHRLDPDQWVAYSCSICGSDCINRVTEAKTDYQECSDCFIPELAFGEETV